MRSEVQGLCVWAVGLALIFSTAVGLITPAILAYLPAWLYYPLALVFTGLVARSFSAGPPVPQALLDKDLTGQIAIVTGAAAGLGFETALQLAKQGATVIVGCRSVKRNEECATMLRERARADGHTGKELIIVTRFVFDAENLKSVREFCAAFLASDMPLHILVNNAGLADIARKIRSAHHPRLELSLCVNALSHLLLTELLEAKLIASGGRVVCVSSWGHTFVQRRHVVDKSRDRLDIETVLDDPHAWSEALTDVMGGPAWTCYGLSKLVNIWHAHHLVAKGIPAVSLHIGFSSTNVGAEYKKKFPVFLNAIFEWLLLYVCLKTVPEGAATQLFACLAEGVKPGENAAEVIKQDETRVNFAGWSSGAEEDDSKPKLAAYLADTADATHAQLSELAKDTELGARAIAKCLQIIEDNQ